jgi:hypothetical protein
MNFFIQVVLAFFFLSSHSFALDMPIPPGENWIICQGYNTKEIDHVDFGNPQYKNNGKYSLDLVADILSTKDESYGCRSISASYSNDKEIASPGDGVVAWVGATDNQFACIDLNEGGSIKIGHAIFNFLKGDKLTNGQIIGKLARANNINTGAAYAHIHMARFTKNDCQSGNQIPFSFEDFSLPDTGEIHQYYGKLVYRRNKSVLDGAGSLVDPNNNGLCSINGNYGCSKDTVRLHPHILPSSGVFQIFNNGGSCDYVQMSGETLPSMYISVKSWNQHYPGENQNYIYLGKEYSTTYKNDNSVNMFTNGISNIPIPPGWVLINFTSQKPLNTSTYNDITLTCARGSYFQFWPGNQLQEVAPSIDERKKDPGTVLNSFDNENYWSGNGSLISFSGNSITNNIGKTTDYAITLSSKKSTVIFQIFRKSTICSNIKLQSSVATDAEISYKPWYVKDWNNIGMVKLPYTLPLTIDGYFIVKVTPKQISSMKIQGSCA